MKAKLIVIFVLLHAVAVAQINMPSANRGEQPNTDTPETLLTAADTVRSVMRVWLLKHRLLHNQPIAFDTTLTDFYLYDPLLKTSKTHAHLGNTALPARKHHFFDQLYTHDFIFGKAYQAYMFNSLNLPFYNTNLPFTHVSHASSTNKVDEQHLEILHTQNITPFFNAGFKYRVINSAGRQTNNKGNVNSFGFWASRLGQRYQIQSNFYINKFENGENGGISKDEFTDNPEYVPINLEAAKSKYRTFGFLLYQKYKLGKEKIVAVNDTLQDTTFVAYTSINHSLHYQQHYRWYRDELSAGNPYYPSAIDTLSTFDSLYHHSLENIVQLQFNENQQARFKFRGRAYARNILKKYGSLWSADSIAGAPGTDTLISNTSIGAAFFDFSSKRWDWNVEGELFLLGRRAGDYSLKALFKRRIFTQKDSFDITLNARYENKEPFYLFENYHSNHYNWQQVLLKEQNLRAEASFHFPKYHFEMKTQWGQFKNFVFLNQWAVPEQMSGLSAFSLQAKKTLHWKTLRWHNEITYQVNSQNDVLQLPLFTYFTQVYAHFFMFRKALELQIGVDMKVATKHSLPAYNPALGIFYRNADTGNELLPVQSTPIPFVGVFANFRIKKVLLFVNFSNLNGLLDSRFRYTTYLYPLEPMTFRWGVYWRFYD